MCDEGDVVGMCSVCASVRDRTTDSTRFPKFDWRRTVVLEGRVQEAHHGDARQAVMRRLGPSGRRGPAGSTTRRRRRSGPAGGRPRPGLAGGEGGDRAGRRERQQQDGHEERSRLGLAAVRVWPRVHVYVCVSCWPLFGSRSLCLTLTLNM